MSVSRKEFLDIIFLIKHAAEVDGHYDYKEREELENLIKEFKMSPEEEQKFSKEKFSVTSSLSSLKSDAAKKLLIDLLVLVIVSDFHVVDEEKSFFNKCIDTLNIDKATLPYELGKKIDRVSLRTSAIQRIRAIQ